MKLYIVVAVCSALTLFVFMIGNLDAQLPYYGLEVFRASDEWKWTQALSANIALPLFAGVSLFASLVGMVVRYLTVNQPTNQHNQLGNQPNQLPAQPTQPAQLPQPTGTTEPLAIRIERADTPQQALLIEEPPEPGELSFAIRRAVLTTEACNGDMNAAADKLGIGYEGVRKNIAIARDKYPEWTNWHVPPRR